jgi:MFS family permease
LLVTEKGHFRPERKALTEQDVAKPWREYRDGLRYLRSQPLMFGIGLLHVGWATGGGAAQILFSLFGEVVFNRGPAGIGMVWSAAGVGLLVGGAVAHWLGPRLSHKGYLWTISASHMLHGLSYICFSQSPTIWIGMLFVGLSRSGVGAENVLNQGQLLTHVDDAYRGRVYSTIESMTWGMMMISLTVAGLASDHASPRVIGAWAGGLATLTACLWTWAHVAGKLPEPARAATVTDELEISTPPNM